jgi:hypothetical protein
MAAACSMFSDEHTCGTSSGLVWNPEETWEFVRQQYWQVWLKIDN